MQLSGPFPVLTNTDTVYAVKAYSEQMASALNAGMFYKPAIVDGKGTNFSSTAAVSQTFWTGSVEISFVANPHGACWVHMFAMTLVPVANYAVSMQCEIRTGAYGGGTQVTISDVSRGQTVYGSSTAWVPQTVRFPVTGLTSGTRYYARLLANADAANEKLNYPYLRVEY